METEKPFKVKAVLHCIFYQLSRTICILYSALGQWIVLCFRYKNT